MNELLLQDWCKSQVSTTRCNYNLDYCLQLPPLLTKAGW